MVRFNLYEIYVPGYDMIMCDGIDIKVKENTTATKAGHTKYPIDFIKGDIDTTFTLINPKDTPVLADIMALSDAGTPFPIIGLAKSEETGKPMPVVRLDGVTLNQGDYKLEAKKEVIPAIGGLAKIMSRPSYQYDNIGSPIN